MCDKKPFTIKEANAVLSTAKKWRKQYRKEQRRYWCYYCKAWHPTSADEFTSSQVTQLLHLKELRKFM